MDDYAVCADVWPFAKTVERRLPGFSLHGLVTRLPYHAVDPGAPKAVGRGVALCDGRERGIVYGVPSWRTLVPRNIETCGACEAKVAERDAQT